MNTLMNTVYYSDQRSLYYFLKVHFSMVNSCFTFTVLSPHFYHTSSVQLQYYFQKFLTRMNY